MNKYLISYIFDKKEGFGLGRTLVDLNTVDIELLETNICKDINSTRVTILNIVKLEKEKKNPILNFIKRLFKKKTFRKQYKKALEKEFNC